jgi:flagellar motor switch protein FliM
MRDTVLARKLAKGGVARSPLPETDVIGESFARLVEDRLRAIVATTVSAMLLETRVMKLSDAVEDIGVPAMLALVEVEDADTHGLLCIDTDLAYHLIDLTLGGDPTQAPVATTRTFTGIDMSLGKIHHRALLEAFGAAVASITGRPITKGMDIGVQYQNISQLRFAPGYVDVLMFSVALDLGDAARTGNFRLLMPLATLDVIRVSAQGAGTDPGRERPDDLWRIQMRRAAAAAPVTVEAVLHRQRLSLAAIEALQPGDVIEVPDNAVNEIELTIDQPGGRKTAIATGHLGAYRGAKVVKLDIDVDPRLRQHVKAAL